MEIPVVDFYCRYLGGFFLTVKCLRFLDLGKKKGSVFVWIDKRDQCSTEIEHAEIMRHSSNAVCRKGAIA